MWLLVKNGEPCERREVVYVEVKGLSGPFRVPVTVLCCLQTVAMEKSKEQLGHSRGLVTAPTLSPHYGNGEAKGL